MAEMRSDLLWVIYESIDIFEMHSEKDAFKLTIFS